GAEHDELATAILIAPSEEQASTVLGKLHAQIAATGRGAVARASLEARGGIVIVDDVRQAVELANEFAPEHLCLHVENADRLLDDVRNAGAVFAGSASAESIGDFTAGPPPLIPTRRHARVAPPLRVQEFPNGDA